MRIAREVTTRHRIVTSWLQPGRRVPARAGAQRQPRGTLRLVRGLGRAPRHDRRLERQHPRRDRPGNPVKGAYYRAVAQLDRHGRFTFTEPNAYSGDNGRAAITNDEHGADLIYAAGNAGQSKTPPNGVILGAGAQFITPSFAPEATSPRANRRRWAASTSPSWGCLRTSPARTTTSAR